MRNLILTIVNLLIMIIFLYMLFARSSIECFIISCATAMLSIVYYERL